MDFVVNMFLLYFQVLQTCHEEVAFLWSKGNVNDNFPSGFGLDLTDHFLMLMIIYEDLTETIESDNSGLILTYDTTYTFNHSSDIYNSLHSPFSKF